MVAVLLELQKMHLLWKVTVLFSVVARCTAATNPLMVALVFRHGERTAQLNYPADLEFDFNGYGIGALTNVGIRQMYDQGTRMGNIYRHLLAKEGTFRHYNLVAKSSSVERCVMSGLSFLSGFFPPGEELLPINWQPVPIYAIPQKDDYLFLNLNCEKWVKMKEEVMLNPPDDVLNMVAEDSEIINLVKKSSKYSYNDSFNVGHLISVLEAIDIQSRWNITPPAEIPSSFWLHRFPKYIAKKLQMECWTDEMKRVKASGMITDLINVMSDVISNRIPQRIFLYSGHDLTLVSIARALKIDQQISGNPSFGATLAFEIHRSEGEPEEIKILFYADYKTDNVTEIEIPECPKPCSFNKFINLNREFMVPDMAEICKIGH